MIFWYQYIGDPLKSVSLCREILKTSKDKMEVADATFIRFVVNAAKLVHFLRTYKYISLKRLKTHIIYRLNKYDLFLDKI